LDTWKHIITDNTDIFCHFWNYNTSPNWINDGKNPEFVDQNEISEFLDIVKPKKYLIENYRPILPIDQKQVITYHGYLSQFYGIMRSARLKKQYEIENNLQYDLVARARYDNFYAANVKDSYDFLKSNSMHGFHFGWDHDERLGRVGDMFWFADSETYDIISDFYLNICTINPKLIKYQDNQPPEFVFFHYIKKCNINIEVNYWDIKVFRKSEDESFSKSRTGYEIW